MYAQGSVRWCANKSIYIKHCVCVYVKCVAHNQGAVADIIVQIASSSKYLKTSSQVVLHGGGFLKTTLILCNPPRLSV